MAAGATSKDPAAGRRGPRGSTRPRRLPVALAAVCALALCGGGLAVAAGFDPDPVPPNHAGRYALFYDGEYAGPLNAFPACRRTVDVVVADGRLTTGSPTARCEIEVGLSMAPVFRQAVLKALAPDPGPTADLVIARVVDGAIVSGVALDDTYISDVTFPGLRQGNTAAPGFLKLELIPANRRLRPADTQGLQLANLPNTPIETASPSVTVSGVTDSVLTTATTVDPRTFTREDRFGGIPTVMSPGTLGLPGARLRVPNWAHVAVSELGAWAEATFAATRSSEIEQRTLTITYRSRQTGSSAPKLTVTHPSVGPSSWDMFERTDSRRILNLGATDPTVTWTGR